MTSKLPSLFSCKKVNVLPQHTVYSHILGFSQRYVFSFIKDVSEFLRGSTVCVGEASIQLAYWKTGEAALLEKKKSESFAVRKLFSLPSLKSQSQTSYWEISDWKKRLWSGVKAFSFDLCWNAKYVSVWTFVLTRWRSKQRWACWKRT